MITLKAWRWPVWPKHVAWYSYQTNKGVLTEWFHIKLLQHIGMSNYKKKMFDASLASNCLENLSYEDKMRKRIEAYHSYLLTMYIRYHKTEHQDTTPITNFIPPLHCLIILMSYEMDVPNAVTFYVFEIHLSLSLSLSPIKSRGDNLQQRMHWCRLRNQ